MEYKVSSDFAAERRLAVTPDVAGWKGLTFRTYMFRAGHPVDGESVDDEVLMLFLGGSATVRVGEQTWDVDGRADVFSGPPHRIYLPPRHNYLLTPRTDCEVAYARARAEGCFAPRFMPPHSGREQAPGGDARRVTTLLGPGEAEHLVCAEVVTPAGAWGDCPLREGDGPAARHGAEPAEVCYHRIKPEAGWAMQRLYADGETGGTDVAVVVRHGDAAMVRGGEAHPVVAAPGHDLYTLHVFVDESESPPHAG